MRLLQTWLRQNVMLPLDRAPFLITDARLLPPAGSCKDCPKRTGAAPDIFADVQGADICTDPPCYNRKAEAHTARLQAAADHLHLRLIAGAEAKTVCYEKSSTLNGYSPLSQVRQDAGGQRLDELIGRTPEGGVLIENPWTRELIKAVPTAEAEGLLLAKGLVKAIEAPAKQTKANSASYADALSRLKSSTDRRVATKYEDLLEAAVQQVVIDTEEDDAADLIAPEVLLVYFASELKFSSGRKVLEALSLQGAAPETLTDAQIYKVTALMLACAEMSVQEVIAKRKGIQLTRLREDAKERVKAEVAAEIAALKKPPKTPAPTAPLARPGTVAAADAKTKKPAPLRKPKLSAQDAQLGIAAAMQGMEEGASADAAESGPDHDPLIDQALEAINKSDMVSIASVQRSLGIGYNRAARLLEALEARGDLSAMDTTGLRALVQRTAQASQPFSIGQRVRVNDDITIQTRQRFAGKTGTITGYQEGEFDWTVTFKGRTGGVSVFAAGEMEAVAS